MNAGWKELAAEEIARLFGTPVTEATPQAYVWKDDVHYMVLRGEYELDEEDNRQDEETQWWSLTRIESGEPVELARWYGDEEMDGDSIEVTWDGSFPEGWQSDYLEGKSDWIGMSITEVLTRFGETVELEVPQAYRHREGDLFLVLMGEELGEDEEAYSWNVVRETAEEFEVLGEYCPENGFGTGEEGVEAPVPEDEDDAEWWEVAPLDWADTVVAKILEK